MTEEEYQQRLNDNRLLGKMVVRHLVNTRLAMPLGVYLDPQGALQPMTEVSLQRKLRNKR